MKQYIILFLSLYILNGCCNPQKPPLPKIDLPYNFDVLSKRDLDVDHSTFSMSLSFCSPDSGTTRITRTNPFVVHDTSDFLFQECLAIYLQDVDFENETVIYCDLGGVREVIHATMNYKIGINHGTKTVRIVSQIASSGSCAGSDTQSFSYSCLVAVPKFPSDYSVIY